MDNFYSSQISTSPLQGKTWDEERKLWVDLTTTLHPEVVTGLNQEAVKGVTKLYQGVMDELNQEAVSGASTSLNQDIGLNEERVVMTTTPEVVAQTKGEQEVASHIHNKQTPLFDVLDSDSPSS